MRVVVVGPESVGKTTLATKLAKASGMPMIPEFARTYLERQRGKISAADMPAIFAGQWVVEQASPVDAILDTDVRMTVLWWERLFPPCPHEYLDRLSRLEPRQTLLLAPDVPWVADQVRYLPGEGQAFFERCRQLLEHLGHPYLVISGSWEEREAQAAQVLNHV